MRPQFEFRTTNVKKSCEGTFSGRAVIATALACVKTSEKLLIEELSQVEDFTLKPVHVSAAPKELRRLLRSGIKNSTLMLGSLNGDGVTFEILLVVGRGGVIAFSYNVEFETG